MCFPRSQTGCGAGLHDRLQRLDSEHFSRRHFLLLRGEDQHCNQFLHFFCAASVNFACNKQTDPAYRLQSRTIKACPLSSSMAALNNFS